MKPSRTSARSVPGRSLFTVGVLSVLALTVPALAATPAMAGTASSSASTAKAGPLPANASNGSAGGSAPLVRSPQQPNSITPQYRAAPTGYPQGIDVSSHDHANGANPPDWPTLAANGLAFAYVKASEGTTYVNPYFNADYNGAKANGIYAGAYAFGRPDLGNPVGQADNLYNPMQTTARGQTRPPPLYM